MFDWIVSSLDHGGYLGVFLLMLTEDLFPPIPSELVMPLAGFLAAQGALSLPLTIAAGTAGSVAGAAFWYWVGFRCGEARLAAAGRPTRALATGSPSSRRRSGGPRRWSDSSCASRGRRLGGTGAAQPVPLAAVVRETIGTLAPLAIARRIDLGLVSAVEIDALGDREDFRTLLEALLDNALRYTPEGGTVDVEMRAEPDAP